MLSPKLSVVLATYNEEKNIALCLESVKDIASEIVIVDGSSTDKTVEIAKRYGAHIIVTDNPPMFHINKQKALDMAKHQWILQLDADERVSPELAKEIVQVIAMPNEEINEYQKELKDRNLFLRHERLLEQRDGKIGKDGEYAGFFIPRLNYFLGKYLRYGGVYPDGVIRLVKKGKAHFPCKDVHEQLEVDGKIGWLQSPLYHYDSPTFSRYIERNNRYIGLLSDEFRQQGLEKNGIHMLKYSVVKPLWWFFLTFGRHKGFKDGWQGFVFSFFSSIRFARAYWRYLKK